MFYSQITKHFKAFHPYKPSQWVFSKDIFLVGEESWWTQFCNLVFPPKEHDIQGETLQVQIKVSELSNSANRAKSSWFWLIAQNCFSIHVLVQIIFCWLQFFTGGAVEAKYIRTHWLMVVGVTFCLESADRWTLGNVGTQMNFCYGERISSETVCLCTFAKWNWIIPQSLDFSHMVELLLIWRLNPIEGVVDMILWLHDHCCAEQYFHWFLMKLSVHLDYLGFHCSFSRIGSTI